MVHKVLRSSKENYLAGLWKQELLRELLWERYTDEGQPHDPALYIAPTWSWASLNGPFWETEESGYDFEESRWQVNVLDTKISPVDDAFGPIESGSLMVQCSLCYIIVSSPRDMSSDWISRQHGWNISTINGVSVTCSARVSLDHPSPAMLALAVISFHSHRIYFR